SPAPSIPPSRSSPPARPTSAASARTTRTRSWSVPISASGRSATAPAGGISATWPAPRPSPPSPTTSSPPSPPAALSPPATPAPPEAAHRGRPPVARPGRAPGARRLSAAARRANREVLEAAPFLHRAGGFSSTVVAAPVAAHSPTLYVAHAGDSRCYRLRDGH